jgi:amino acid permease
MIHKFWFKPKEIGYGARPTTWEGWAFSGTYVAVIAIAAVVMLSSRHDVDSFGAWLVFGILVACLTVLFVLFCKAKTEGDWHWRNGQDKT